MEFYMNEKYIKLKIEYIINKILYEKNIIEKDMYNYTAKKLDKLLYPHTSSPTISIASNIPPAIIKAFVAFSIYIFPFLLCFTGIHSYEILSNYFTYLLLHRCHCIE